MFVVAFVLFAIFGSSFLKAQESGGAKQKTEEMGQRLLRELDVVPTVSGVLEESIKRSSAVRQAQEAIAQGDYTRAEVWLKEAALYEGEALNALVWYMLFYCGQRQDQKRVDLPVYHRLAYALSSPEFMQRLNEYYFGSQ